MIKRFREFLVAFEKRMAPPIPVRIDRSHFLKATDPVEIYLAEALHDFPPGELDFLILSFGLDGHTPRGPQSIAEELGMMLLKVLDIGTGAELRLRNRKETRSLIEAIAGQEVAALERHLEVVDIADDEQFRRTATNLWFHSRRPLRRLAMSTALEGGFGAFLALVRRNRHRRPGLVRAARLEPPGSDGASDPANVQ